MTDKNRNDAESLPNKGKANAYLPNLPKLGAAPQGLPLNRPVSVQNLPSLKAASIPALSPMPASSPSNLPSLGPKLDEMASDALAAGPSSGGNPALRESAVHQRLQSASYPLGPSVSTDSSANQEAARSSQEAARISQEAARISQEAARISQEAARISQEYESAEPSDEDEEGFDEDAPATVSIAQPSMAEIEAAIKASRAAAQEQNKAPVLPQGPAQFKPVGPANFTPAASKPFAVPALGSAIPPGAQAALPPLAAPLAPALPLLSPAAPLAAPLASALPLLSPAAPAVAAKAEPAAAPVDRSENDDEGSWEEEEEGDLGEKTMMLDAFDAPEEGGEKTQITLSAMDYEPLSGKFVVESGKTNQREYVLAREKSTIGRGPNNDITISDISMSRRHVEIDKFREGFRLRDLESGNGTMLNGHRIRVGQLRSGDIIEIGNIRFRFEQSGGDPSELWKGDPKVTYHPNQTRTNAQSSQGPQTEDLSAVSNDPIPQSVQPPVVSDPAQMESMIQRPGGIAAAAWSPPANMGGMPPMTNPYMMTYGNPNALRNVRTTPIWAVIMVSVAALCIMMSLVFVVITWFNYENRQNMAEVNRARLAEIKSQIEIGVNSYAEKRLRDAKNSFLKVKEIDPENPLVDLYIRLIAAEDDVAIEIDRVRRQSRSMSSNELEKSIEYFKGITIDSVYHDEIQRNLMPLFLNDYGRRLKSDIRDKISKEEVDEARRLIARLGALDGSASDVTAFNKLIDDREKVKR